MQSDLRETWQKLKGTEKDVATVISMHYEPIALNDLVRMLNKLDVRTELQEKFYLSNVRDYINTLTEKQIVEGVLNGQVQVHTAWREPILRWASDRPHFLYLAEDFRQLAPYKSFWQPYSKEAMLREWRLAYYLRNKSRFEALERELNYFYPKEYQNGFFHKALFQDTDLDWLFRQADFWQEVSLQPTISKIVDQLESPAELLAHLETDDHINRIHSSELLGLLHRIYVLTGRWQSADDLIKREKEDWLATSRQGELSAILGQDNEALQHFDRSRASYRRRQGKRQGFPDNWGGYIYLLTLLRMQGIRAVPIVEQLLQQIEPQSAPRYFQTLLAAIQVIQNKEEAGFHTLKKLEGGNYEPLDLLAWGQAVYWTEYEIGAIMQAHLRSLFDRSYQAGYHWLAFELASVLELVSTDPENREHYGLKAQELGNQLKVESWLHAVPRLERWERALAALEQFTNAKVSQNGADHRLVWWIDFDNEEIEAREQTLGKNGQWSKGRRVAPKRVRYGEVNSMQAEDLAVAQAVVELQENNRFNPPLTYDFKKAILALIGHPRLFLLRNPGVGIELVRREPRLLLEEHQEELELRFAQEFEDEGIQIIRETPTRYAVLEIGEDYAKVRRQIGRSLRIPGAARSRVRHLVRHLGHLVPVQSTLPEDLEGIPISEGDTKIYVHLLPLGDGFKMEFFVRPKPDEVLYRKPGRGRERLYIQPEGEGRPQIVERQLEAELANAQAVVARCPTLQRIPADNWEWPLDAVNECLSALLELQPLKEDGTIILEHPKGEQIRLAGQVGLSDLSLVVEGATNWFEVDGELQLDNQHLLHFRELLQRVKKSDNNFIQLSNGDYLALTQELARRLHDMESLLTEKSDELRLHPLALSLLDEMSDELAEFEVDMAWRQQLDRIQKAREIEPVIPTDFRAELRTYQREGFDWLIRLATWGVGACLADDMGLGKTVQALAVILARADQGPTLVVAPASVTRNWRRETEKFAPTLNPILLGSADRGEVIDQLGPRDLLLVSYGLLPFEGDRLSQLTFTTIVLDEAQAIKNRNTKRSKVAMELKGEFRMVTTGTPIENHLGELWNLFSFLNPGLLGSHRQFGERFAIPISRYNDKDRREQLRRLLQPFILRRRKSEVLQELPPKTEVILTVELSEQEKAFYEALRLNALTEIEETPGPGKRFQILAQLTRLRQAACHPRLVKKNVELESSKLELVGSTILELLDNGHKALVFSQFVEHLRIVEQWVKDHRISYQYLDGQTPGPKRDQAVQAFQAGEGDLFLISLKAGGTGLTLTSADYVLHLDPWWNPAVEDQASDRAHRIGQDRPVTVYRFVSEHTIEEKIVQLHQEKRDLADSLLSGTEASASLSTDELIDLIRQK